MSGLDEKTVPLTVPDGTLRLPGATVRVVEGPDEGREATVTGRAFEVGTAPDNDFVLTDRAVSRHHLTLELDETSATIVDHASTNGTLVNGVRVMRAVVTPGVRITLGHTVLAILPSDQPVVIHLSPRASFGELIGDSVPMRELYAMLERIASSDASVLLTGETGTGKELVAEAIHEASPRRDGPLVIVDCGAIPEALFESELFGYVKGAFTGANHDKPGLLTEAHGGTVFLDEIGELAPQLQPKLLRALERRHVRPVGSSKHVDIDVRVVSATHRDLTASVNDGTFREDLYYRLAVVRLQLPALRARPGDLPLLVHHFVERLAPDRAHEADAIAAELAHRSFPGNVRELRNAVEERLVLGRVGEDHGVSPEGDGPWDDRLMTLSYRDAIERMTERFQREYVTRLLERTEGNVSKAAREAGMSRRYLQTVISRLRIETG